MKEDPVNSTVKLSEKTVLSLHLVVILLGFAVWIIRLSDKVDQHEKALIDLKQILKENQLTDQRLYRIEEHFGIKHPPTGRDSY